MTTRDTSSSSVPTARTVTRPMCKCGHLAMDHLAGRTCWPKVNVQCQLHCQMYEPDEPPTAPTRYTINVGGIELPVYLAREIDPLLTALADKETENERLRTIIREEERRALCGPPVPRRNEGNT